MPISFSSSSSTKKTSTTRKGSGGSGGRGGGGGRLFAFTCACKDSNTAFIAPSPANSSTTTSTSTSTSNLHRHSRPKSGTSTLVSTSTSTSSIQRHGQQQLALKYADIVAEEKEEKRSSTTSSATFSDLLRELGKLEQRVIALDKHRHNHEEEEEEDAEDYISCRPSLSRRRLLIEDDKIPISQSDGIRIHDWPDWVEKPGKMPHRRQEEDTRFTWFSTKQPEVDRRGKLGDSVAVVTETEDPIGDFRESMLAMIVENEIDSEGELKELLGEFLTLNLPQNHHLILRAFAHVWNDVFSSRSGGTPEAYCPQPEPARHGHHCL